MAIHVVTDSIAHKAYWKVSQNHYEQIDHNNGADVIKYSKSFKYGNSKFFSDRFDYARYITYRVLRAAKAGHQISYSAYVPEEGSEMYSVLMKQDKLRFRNLKPHAYRGNGGSVSNAHDIKFLSHMSYYKDNGNS